MNNFSSLICTSSNQCCQSKPFGGIDLYKMGRNLDRSDLTELRLRVQNNGMVKEKRLWQDFFMRYGTLHIDSYSDNLMHFKYLEVVYG